MSSEGRHGDPPGREHCPRCGSPVDRLAARCPGCETALPAGSRSHHHAHSRRYVYGKRRPRLSREAAWLIAVIVVGLVLVLVVQLLAHMRARRLLLAPTPQRLAHNTPPQGQPCGARQPQGAATRPPTTATR